MQISELIQLVESVSKSEVRQFVYRTEDEFLSINKTAEIGRDEKVCVNAEKNGKLVDVTAPSVGTVILSDSKTGHRYVELGDKVTKGQLLFVMESMKLFTDVIAPINGKIVQICVDNNQTVDFDTLILKIIEGS